MAGARARIEREKKHEKQVAEWDETLEKAAELNATAKRTAKRALNGHRHQLPSTEGGRSDGS